MEMESVFYRNGQLMSLGDFNFKGGVHHFVAGHEYGNYHSQECNTLPKPLISIDEPLQNLSTMSPANQKLHISQYVNDYLKNPHEYIEVQPDDHTSPNRSIRIEYAKSRLPHLDEMGRKHMLSSFCEDERDLLEDYLWEADTHIQRMNERRERERVRREEATKIRLKNEKAAKERLRIVREEQAKAARIQSELRKKQEEKNARAKAIIENARTRARQEKEKKRRIENKKRTIQLVMNNINAVNKEVRLTQIEQYLLAVSIAPLQQVKGRQNWLLNKCLPEMVSKEELERYKEVSRYDIDNRIKLTRKKFEVGSLFRFERLYAPNDLLEEFVGDECEVCKDTLHKGYVTMRFVDDLWTEELKISLSSFNLMGFVKTGHIYDLPNKQQIDRAIKEMKARW